MVIDVNTAVVTGGSGFVGRHIVRRLREAGLRVRVVVRSEANLGDLAGDVDCISTTDLFAESDERLRALIAGANLLVHAAWYVDPRDCLWSDQNLHCLSGSIRLAKAFVDSGVGRFVGIGTSAEYEARDGLLATSTPLRPETLYGACKASAFQVIDRLVSHAGKSFLWCRLFNLFGEGEHPSRLVPYMRSRLATGQPVDLSAGDQFRDYLPVGEASRMIAVAALSGREGAINICSGVPISVRQLAEQVADEYGRRDLLTFGVRPIRSGEQSFTVGEKSDDL